MKTAKTLTLALLTIALAAVGCGTTGTGDSDSDSDSDSGSGGSGSDSDSGTGGSGTDSDSDSGLGGNAGADGGDGSGASGTTGGSSNDGSGGLSFPDDIEFEYDPSLDMEPETCADVQIDSEEIFLDIFVILDRSGSMTQPFGNQDSDGYCEIGGTYVASRWCNAITSVHGFFSDPTTVGTGLSYGEFRGSGGDCLPVAMDLPFGIVEAGDTNGQLAALVTRLNDNDPNGGTPTQRAINTLVAETSIHMPTGTRRTIGLLITDGDPNSDCDDNVNNLNATLVNHFTATDIPTFIIGMDGATTDNLEIMAAGAGAEPHDDFCDGTTTGCSYYTVGDGNPAAFIAALDSIRSSVLGCEYSVPNADVGVGNLDTLDVQFTPAEGEAAIGLTRVGNEVACTDDDEYFVELGADDSIIKLCPATCDLRGEGASVDISLKCEGS